MAPRLLDALTDPSHAVRTVADDPRATEAVRRALDRIKPGWRVAHAARAPELTAIVLDVQKSQFDRARALRLLDEADTGSCARRGRRGGGRRGAGRAALRDRHPRPFRNRASSNHCSWPPGTAESHPAALAIEAVAKFGRSSSGPGALRGALRLRAEQNRRKLLARPVRGGEGARQTEGPVGHRASRPYAHTGRREGGVAPALAAIGGHRAAEILREVLSVPRNAYGGGHRPCPQRDRRGARVGGEGPRIPCGRLSRTVVGLFRKHRRRFTPATSVTLSG